MHGRAAGLSRSRRGDLEYAAGILPPERHRHSSPHREPGRAAARRIGGPPACATLASSRSAPNGNLVTPPDGLALTVGAARSVPPPAALRTASQTELLRRPVPLIRATKRSAQARGAN